MLRRDPLWYKDAVIYEVHVRAFHDSVGDGTGDFRGLAQKLDYLQDLGVTAIWVLPFYPSPLRDDGYDIADYMAVHKDYGTLDSFREFLDAAHARDLRVITELVINHTSDQHAWFQRARRAPPGSVERDFYVWTDNPEKYRDARIIFKDFETSNWAWDKVAQAYYWHRFYSHQPDLNFDNPAVWQALLPVVDFWLGMGVDAMRLDAIPYLFEREGTNCENLPETHTYLKSLRKHVDDNFPDRMLLAEANQWPEDSVAYFGDGDECHMAFHFPVMPRLFMAMHMEDRLPIIDIMQQTPAIPENCQWAMFLRNHDELTLEMVTDEERDYMYQAYATDPRARINLGIRHRLAPLLGNNRRRIELMNGLLFSLPGTPVLYYGDEIGMGDNIYLGDRNGVRTPMQWSADRNAGFSRANPQKLYLPVIIDPEYHYEAINVEAQQNNLNSLLWWTKRLIGLRRSHKAFSRGKLEFLRPLNRHILAFLRTTEEETILVVANLSRFVQCAELDLSALEGSVPVELFGATRFPIIGKTPYPMMLGPHSFYWFQVTREAVRPTTVEVSELPTVRLGSPWSELAKDPAIDQLESILVGFLPESSSRPRHGRPIRRVRVTDVVTLPMPAASETGDPGTLVQILMLESDSPGVKSDQTWLPLLLTDESAIDTPASDLGRIVLARVTGRASGCLVDARSRPEFHQALARMILSGGEVAAGHLTGGEAAELVGVHRKLAAASPEEIPAGFAISGGGSSLSAILGEQYALTEFLRLDQTPSPELALGRWLSEQTDLTAVPHWLGSLEYRRHRDDPLVMATLQTLLPTDVTAWQLGLEELSRFYERVLSLPAEFRDPPSAETPTPPGELVADVIGTLGSYLNEVRTMGARLADVHRAAISAVDLPQFTPEAYSLQSQRSVYQSFRNLMQRVLREIHHSESQIPEEARDTARSLLERHGEIDAMFHKMVERPLRAYRTRIHGDCHLGHVVRAGRDYYYTDFDNPTQPVGERRIKRSPVRDVAGMLHSFDVVAESALYGISSRRGQAVGVVRPEDQEHLARWTRFWRENVADAFVTAYREGVAGDRILDTTPEDFSLLRSVFELERSLSDVGHLVATRPSDSALAIRSLLRFLDEAAKPKNP